MATVIVIPQPIRADVDESDDPHIFAEVTTEPFLVPHWNDAGELVVEFPTVDLTLEQMNEVVRIARAEPALADLGGTVALPPQIIPEEGVTQFAQLLADAIVFRYLQGDIGIIGRLFVASYASDADGETTPAADSNIVELNSTPGSDLFSAKAPTGEVNDDGEPLFTPLVTIPQNRWDPEGNRIPAVFNGNIITDFVTVLKAFTIQGAASDGYLSHIAPNAEQVLDNAISDPDTEPLVEFAPKPSRWPATSGFEEIGFGTHNGFVVQGRIDKVSGNNQVTARFINPDTGILDHSVTLSIPFHLVGGFCAGGGYLYVLDKFSKAGDPWAIHRFDPNTGVYDGTFVNVDNHVKGDYAAAISHDAGRVRLLVSDAQNDVHIHEYGNGLDKKNHIATGINTARPMVGTDGTYVAAGSRIYHRSDNARSYWSYNGVMTGWGAQPDGQHAATFGTGTRHIFNSEVVETTPLWASWTKRDTVTGRETRQGPRASRNWPARMFATIQTGSSIGSGYDDTEIYASSTGPARTQMWRITGIPDGRTQTTIAAAPTAGDNPPATNGFEGDTSGTDPGRLRSGALDSNGEPLTYLDGDGDAQFLKVMQRGKTTVSTVLDSNEVRSVTFAVPFTFPPIVGLSVADEAGNVDPQQIDELILENVTTTGFDFKIRRTGGSGDVTVHWTADKATQ